MHPCENARKATPLNHFAARSATKNHGMNPTPTFPQAHQSELDTPHPRAMARRPSIFITGAASGIGRACAELFAQRGWFVGVFDIHADGAASVAAALGKHNAFAGTLDVCSPTAWNLALAEFWKKSGQRLDVLLNNAGVLASGRFEDLPLDKQNAMLEINVGGMITGCHSAFTYLQQTPNSHVINMASATAIYGQPELATYSATKFAVRGFTEALDLEWSQQGIRVSAIWPTFVMTAMADHFGQLASAKSLGIQLGPADVASTVLDCATSCPTFHTPHRTVGVQAAVLSLATRFGPSALTRWIVQRMSMSKPRSL